MFNHHDLRKVYCSLRRWVGLCLFLLSFSVSAQYPGYRAIPDLPGFKKKFAAESQGVLSITSNFIQVKTLSALTETITSTGKFWYKRKNLVRLEYTKPFFYLMILKGDNILIRDDQKESRINTTSNKLFQQVNRLLIDCVQGSILESKDFSFSAFENEQTILLEMKPVSKGLGEFVSTLVLTIEKRDYSVKSIDLHELLGDKTSIIFTNKKLNEPVSDEIFSL